MCTVDAHWVWTEVGKWSGCPLCTTQNQPRLTWRMRAVSVVASPPPPPQYPSSSTWQEGSSRGKGRKCRKGVKGRRGVAGARGGSGWLVRG